MLVEAWGREVHDGQVHFWPYATSDNVSYVRSEVPFSASIRAIAASCLRAGNQQLLAGLWFVNVATKLGPASQAKNNRWAA